MHYRKSSAGRRNDRFTNWEIDTIQHCVTLTSALPGPYLLPRSRDCQPYNSLSRTNIDLSFDLQERVKQAKHTF